MEKQQPKNFNPPILKLISVVSGVYLLYYLWWRVTSTLAPDALIFSWVLFLAEAFGVFNYLLFSWMTSNIAPFLPAQKLRKENLKVDVFIPTYNEDLDILEATLVGCKNIRYPHQTYLLDDGNRPAARELAARLGADYIARPTHEHAKAGNINYALTQTDGDFIVILDADMVPQPEYLDRTLGYFDDEKVALIQLPQEFYNQDSIQHASNTPSWHEQALFFRVIQPGKNYTNSAFWCGSPSVVRRSALEDVGGVATETITEDIHTTVRLHSRGWKTLYVNEPLAYGIAPQTMESFLLQRLRWAQGTMQLYRSKESPLWKPGLTWQQRLSYLSSFLAYFESFQKLVLVLTPVIILTLKVFPMQVSMGDFLLRWIPYFALNFLANQVGGRGVFQYFKTEKYNILKMVVFIQSTLTLIHNKKLKFKVTPKSVDASVYMKESRVLRFYMAIAGVLAGSMVYGIMEIFSLHEWTLSWDVFFIAFFWAAYNDYIILFALLEVFGKKHERKHYRFPVNLHGTLTAKYPAGYFTQIKIMDLSMAGVGFALDKTIPLGFYGLRIQVQVPGFGTLSLPLESIHYQRMQNSSAVTVGASLTHIQDSERERLIEFLYINLARTNTELNCRVMDWDPFSQLRKYLKRLLPAAR